MTEDQIPEFVSEVLATGCDILAIGDDGYVIADCEIPDDIYETVEPALARICVKYFARDHLRYQIVAYLHSIGRAFPPPPRH
ncbi:MAG TPA: hypothetical protein VGO22_13270 [Pseudorhizobium sp.]|nr:hypothetical protein [Pseudorhizobium sp.]